MNHSTVHLQPVPTVLSAEAALARIAALEAKVARLRVGLDSLRLTEHRNHLTQRDCRTIYQLGYRCTCGVAAHNARIDALLAKEDS